MIYANIAICAAAILIYSVMIYSLSASGNKATGYFRSFLWILSIAIIQAAADMISVIPALDGFWVRRITLIVLNTSCYLMASIYSVLLYQFCRDLAGEEKTVGKRWFMASFILCGVQAVVVVVMTLTGLLYGDSPNVRGVSQTAHLVILMLGPMLIMIGNILVAARNPISTQKKISIIIFCLIPFLIIPLNILATDIARVPVFLFQIVDLYCNIYMRQKEEGSAQQLKLENYRSKLLFSQIEPHFLYNTITGVISLCDIDPEEAKELLRTFAGYLRTHLDSLQKDEPVSLERELEHTQAYLAIEKTRFGETVEVEYDIRATEIFLPPLTLQPLVENAVKHGITMKPGGGTVRISSWEDRRNGYVRIEDDGVGFDPETLKASEHVGIRSTELRLQNMVHGSLKITSKKEEGTSVLIEVPREA